MQKKIKRIERILLYVCLAVFLLLMALLLTQNEPDGVVAFVLAGTMIGSLLLFVLLHMGYNLFTPQLTVYATYTNVKSHKQQTNTGSWRTHYTRYYTTDDGEELVFNDVPEIVPIGTRIRLTYQGHKLLLIRLLTEEQKEEDAGGDSVSAE